MTTQILAAKSGEITSEMLKVAQYEELDPIIIRERVAQGTIVIPGNRNRKKADIYGIGQGLKTKINANIGTSEKRCNLPEEIQKLKVAIQYGAHSVMDLSTGGNLHHILKTIIDESSVMIGTVPIYSVATEYMRKGNEIRDIDFEAIFDEIEYQAELGVDFMTLHCGITKHSLHFLKNDPRVLGIVSRGGSIIKHWIEANNRENPLYEEFDRVLEICRKHDVTISLGDGVRPGAGADATDRGQIAELLTLGELVDRARDYGVQVMVEGPGHMPMNQIEINMKIMKRICHEAPFYVLGPLVTDSAPGYDHIVGAIGGAIAAMHGADFLCYVTPAEHLCLPTIDDVREGVIASLIAAHAADIVKGIKSNIERDYLLSVARRKLDWETMFKLALEPTKARQRRLESEISNEDYCSMCGNLCAIKINSL